MPFHPNPEIGNRIITLMAALVLVLQIAAVGQRWIVSSIRIFAVQSFLLGAIAAVIAYFHQARDIYIAALLTVFLKAGLLPRLLYRLVGRIGIPRAIQPLLNLPPLLLLAGCLTPLGFSVP